MTLLWLPLLVSSLLPGAKPVDPELAKLTATLRAKDQVLLDAIAPGDRKAWEQAISADFVYVDENDRIIPRAQFLKEIAPLAKGVAGSLAIRTYQVQRQGDTAVVVHYDDETEHYYGSELHAEYVMTETWQLTGSEWKLRVVHCAAVPADPQAVALPDAEMDALVGTYTAGDLTYTIRRAGKRLMGMRKGHSESELKAETRDVLFAPGQPRSRKVFQRDGQGKVTGFADRREGRDLVWVRVP